jgi:hypothetical protein
VNKGVRREAYDFYNARSLDMERRVVRLRPGEQDARAED